MGKKKSADESPKTKVAKRVVTAKRRYFTPDAGREVEAENLTGVVKVLNATEEGGDGNK